MSKEDRGEEKTWYLMFQTSERIRNYSIRQSKGQKGVKRWKLSVSQLRLVSCIVAQPELKIKIKDIAKELSITSGGVSQLVDSLERMGLLMRCHDEVDRRIVFVTLSELGYSTYRESVAMQDNMFGKLLKNISEEKLAIFHDVLHEIQAKLDILELEGGELIEKYTLHELD